MNKFITLAIGVLFLLGLVVLSFYNFLQFSPATPGIVASTQAYITGGIEIENVQGDPKSFSFTIKNEWADARYDIIYYMDGNMIPSGDGPIYCQITDGKIISLVVIKKGEQATISCKIKEGYDFYVPSGDGGSQKVEVIITEVCVNYTDDPYEPLSKWVCRDIN